MYCRMKCPSPLGELTIVANESAITALVMAGQKRENQHVPTDAREMETPLLRLACQWLGAYFAGERPDADALPLAPEGTDFQKRVWRELLMIPYGETRSYGALAKTLHSSPRAVGGAVGRNPISILIPCHRVLGSNGSLTGYDGGLARKKQLLLFESATKAETR